MVWYAFGILLKKKTVSIKSLVQVFCLYVNVTRIFKLASVAIFQHQDKVLCK
jgi:hypothetical protein